MTDVTSSSVTRRAILGVFAATTIAAAPTAGGAFFKRGSGDIRRIKMYSGRTGERLDDLLDRRRIH